LTKQLKKVTMKKKLLLGSAILTAISAVSQSNLNRPVSSRSVVNAAERYAEKHFSYEGNAFANQLIQPTVVSQQPQRPMNSANNGWITLSGSMNIYGVSDGDSKPLQYHPGLGAVSFIHRKSFAYQSSPPINTPTAAASGIIVAEVCADMINAGNGAQWDSTCVWANTALFARYPQGGIYNPPGNTSLSNAYVLATGPVTNGNTSAGWVGSYLASKKLDVYNNVASTASAIVNGQTITAQQFVANTAPFNTAQGKFDFPHSGFSATDDGAIRVMGKISKDENATTSATRLFRGARVLKATFTSGVFVWTGDSIIPSVNTSSTLGFPQIISTPKMCWNQQGTVGYVWFLGSRQGRTGANMGIQPIVYKTTNSGATWTEINGINFNATATGSAGPSYFKKYNPAFYDAVIKPLDTVRQSSLKIPQFTNAEGIDGVVDKDDNLHLVTTIISTSTNHADSMFFIFQYTGSDGEKYNWSHSPGKRPYIYDFTTFNGPNGLDWKVTVVDSMSSESPGSRPNDPGYNSNPWDVDPSNNNNKLNTTSRIQCSRSVDGKYIVYTWAESDTNYTFSNFKWNNIPNVKARAMDLSGTATPLTNTAQTLQNYMAWGKINITNPLTTYTFGPVQGNAHMHFASPICKVASSATTFTVTMPLTVSNNANTPLKAQAPSNHYYTSANMKFVRIIEAVDDIQGNISNSQLYPNPAKGSANLTINLKSNTKVELKVVNLMGEVVKTSVVETEAGLNNINVDLSGVASGIYMVNVQAGNASATKKLIVE
jgi:hypothetical protein